MATLQKSFKYLGNPDNNLINDIQLELHVPFDSFQNQGQKKSNVIIAEHDIEDLSYQIEIPTDQFLADDASTIYWFFLLQSIEVIKQKYLLKFKDKFDVELGRQELEVTYFLIEDLSFDYVVHVEQQATEFIKKYGNFPKIDKNALAERYKKEKGNIFIANSKEFIALQKKINSIFPNSAHFLKVKWVSWFTDLVEGFPTLSSNIDLFKGQVEGYLKDNSVAIKNVKTQPYTNNLEFYDDAIAIIKEDFHKLFDFPITVPAIELLEIGGTFQINTEPEVTLNKSDLDFYKITAEYSEIGSNFKLKTIDWSSSKNEITDNQIPISFTDESQIVKNSIAKNVIVKVKGFDGSILWSKELDPDDPQLQALEIEVDQFLPNTLGTAQGENKSSGKKLRGKVIQMGDRYELNELTIIIEGKSEENQPWQIIGSATTDSAGNFSLEYPYGNYSHAQATVSLMPNDPAIININTENTVNESIADEFVYLLLRDNVVEYSPPEENEDDDCGCHTPGNKAKRLPDQADLIESGEYTQDMGGSCLNLSTPNRTLREYNYNAIVRISDPEVSNYVLKKKEIGNKIVYDLEGGVEKLQRKVVDLDNPIRWEDAPDAKSNLSLYQAVTVATGHILHYKSVFKADGYSLGDLVYSLPLAPGQKKQIVVFESSHSLSGAESQTLSQGERLSADLVSDRFITDQLSGGISENLSGRSRAKTSGVSAGLGLGGSYGGIGGSLGVAGGYAKSNSSASQNGSRNVSQFFGEKLRQSVMQNAESYRSLNASVVTTVTEGQDYGVTTETVANHNHCHSLTMMYFEVLRHYAIFQELSHVEECVFVPLLMTNFSTENIHKWKDVLATNLLPIPSNTYFKTFPFFSRSRRSHPFLKAFDANERIKTNYENVEFPLGQYADEHIQELSGYVKIRVHIPRPKTRFDRILSFPIIKKTITGEGGIDVSGTLKDTIKDTIVASIVPCAAKGPRIKRNTTTTEVLAKGEIFDMFMTLDANFETVPPARCIRVNFDGVDVFDSPFGILFDGDSTVTPMDFFAGMTKEKELWESYASILEIPLKELFAYFNNNLIGDWDRIFNDHIAPQIIEKLIHESTLSFSPFDMDITEQRKYKGGHRILTYNLLGEPTTLTRAEVDKIKINYTSPISGAQKDTFFDFVTFNLESIYIKYSTPFSNGTIIRRTLRNDLQDSVPEITTPLSSYEKRSPRKDDLLLVSKLIEHLNSNLEYYNKILWYNLDPDRRYMLLDGFNIEIFNSVGNSAGFRSLASVVKNELITITGNSLVFPVASGYKVSQAYILEDVGENVEQEISLFDHYKPLTPLAPYRISVPTRGVFMEAIQGSCDACELVKENSSQDWDKFRTEESTPIAEVVTPTPAITNYQPNYRDFANPLVSIQNAPDAPAPGVGLTTLSDLLGKAGVFNDITGLAGNQQNVLETYKSNQENAKAFAEMAKSLSMQQHNTSNSDDITNRIQDARRAGSISDEDSQALTRAHLQQQIDGGESSRNEAQAEREQNRTSLTDVAANAANQGQSVSAERTDADGNREAVDITGREGQGNRVNIVHNISGMAQRFDNDCWATAATIMMNWKNSSSTNVEDVLREAGNNLSPVNENYYLEIFNRDIGLAASEKQQFISTLGMFGAEPTNFPLSQYVDWLQNYGPLWITTDDDDTAGFSPHARILFSIEGDIVNAPNDVDFTFLNPTDGQETTDTFEEFINFYEQAVTDNQDDDLFIQVVRFTDRIRSGEGSSSSTVSTPSTPCRAFVPTDLNKIVLNQTLFDPPRGNSSDSNILPFRNWGANSGDPGAGRGVIHFINTKNTYGCRNINDLQTIILHETGRNNASGHSLPGVTNRELGVHFLIENDGKIDQFNDIVDLVPHGSSGWNDNSVGIEFANAIFSGNAGDQISLNWEGANYQVPSIEALESCYSLVSWLVANLPNVPDSYLSHMNIPSGAHAGEMAWHIHYHPTSSAAPLYSSSPGIISHNVYNKQKADGWFQALYCWCRSSNGENLAPADALIRAKEIAQSDRSKIVRINGNIFILL